MGETPASTVGQVVKDVQELQKMFTADEPVVGVRNVRAGGVWLKTIDCDKEHPEERLGGVGQGKDYGILPYIEWRRLREHDEGVRMGWIIRDDSGVPGTMTIAPDDPDTGNCNALLDAEIEKLLGSRGVAFSNWMDGVDSIVTLERAISVAEGMKDDNVRVYPRLEELDLRLLVLRALEERMPKELGKPQVTMDTMRAVAEREDIALPRDEQRSRDLMLRALCRYYVGEG